ncbi:hedgehog receptor activity protein [Tritrichomonas musculus]|uniref:Hedgehog receptor activity protein n=1 Tax=Tritrichomonas musculus TaxID=1915356 RepID=A0ABR2IPY9_9EUKA
MLDHLDFEEKKASKVKFITRIYSNFTLKYPIVLFLLSLIISCGLFATSCFVYGMWPLCNQNYYVWSGDEISEKWNSYLASMKNTYSSLQKLLTSSFSIPYQFELTQVGCLFYQRNLFQKKKLSNSYINQSHIINNYTNQSESKKYFIDKNIDEIDDSQNVLTAECLRAIWEIEDKMHQTEGWSDYCYKIPRNLLPSFLQPFLDNILDYMRDHLSELEEDTNCLAFKSIITEFKKFMRSSLNISNPKPSDLTDKIVYDYINGYDDLNRSIEARLKITYFGTDYTHMKTTKIRSLVMAGLPIKGYDSKNDRFNEQKKKLGKWQTNFLKPLFDEISNKTSPIYPCAALPFEIEYEIFDIVVQHLPYFAGALGILFTLSCIASKSFILGIFGSVGIILSALFSVAIINIIFQLHYFDVINAMAIYMSSAVGGLCNLYILQIYKNNNSFLFIVEKTTKTMLMVLFFNSFTYLSVLLFGTKIGQYFGFYSFILNINYFVTIFTWFIPLLSLYSKCRTKKFRTESVYSLNSILLTSANENEASLNYDNNDASMKKSSSTLIVKDSNPIVGYTNSKSTPNLANIADSELNSEFINIEPNSQMITTNSASQSYSNNSTNIFSYAETLNDYPNQKIFDFFKTRVTFNLNCCNQFPTNFIEKFICYHWWPFIYFYRIIFIFIGLILLAANIYFVTQINTKNKISFLKKDHRIQRAMDLSATSFVNPLNDNAFVYVWGLNNKSYKSYKSWTTIDDYGYHKSFNSDEVNLSMITNPNVQSHIMETWALLHNFTDIIDVHQSEHFGFNPWETWNMIANTDFGPFDFIFKFLNFTEPPTNITSITPEQYHSYIFVWQLLLSLTTMQETDNYDPGTLMANTIGFSFSDYSLKFIGMKMNMLLTKHNSHEELKSQYNRAKEIESIIQKNAISKGIPEFKGWMTSAAWIPLVVEENMKKNLVIIFSTSLVLSLIAPIFFVSYKMSITILFGSFGSLVFTLGTLKVCFNWELGLNEALMIAVTNSFASVFLQITVFDAFSKNNKKLPKFGKIQIALMNSSFPLSLILLFLLGSIPILIFCPFQYFPPFVIYLFFADLFCFLWGLIISPIILSFIL